MNMIDDEIEMTIMTMMMTINQKGATPHTHDTLLHTTHSLSRTRTYTTHTHDTHTH